MVKQSETARKRSKKIAQEQDYICVSFIAKQDNVAEWLRRWIANPLLFERASSNLAVVDSFFAHVTYF